MAVVKFEGGWTLAAVADAALPTHGGTIVVNCIVVAKATAGTVTLKDGGGAVFMIPDMADTDVLVVPLNGWECSGVEYDAVEAGSALVTVFGTEGGKITPPK